MCGIFGYTSFKDSELLEARETLFTLKHRGPDQWGDYFIPNKIYIGHCRLSILDLSENGKQPIVTNNNNIAIATNGEIYNYKALRDELSLSRIFESDSDSEVLLHGYVQWGIEGLLNRIEGMYAFSIYDREKNSLYLARDRVGIKPLYYSTENNEISWASELKAIVKHYKTRTTLECDHTALYDFLTYGYIPTPKSLYQNVYKLEPAHYLEVNLSDQNVRKVKYWDLKTFVNTSITPKEATDKLRVLISKSVKEQTVSDVPISFFLSGGIDSSTVVAFASSLLNEVHTFSIGFDEKKHDESEYADIVSKLFKTKHTLEKLGLSKVQSQFGKIHHWFDEPFADTSCFPTYLVSKLAKSTSTVALTGDGGDEVFGGYRWYKQFISIKQKKFITLPSFFRQVFSILKKPNNIIGRVFGRLESYLVLDDLEIYTKILGGMIKADKVKYAKKWNIPEAYDDYWYYRKFYNENLPIMTRLQYLDFHTYLPDDILTKVDRVSMAVALEARVPLLSTEIIEFSFTLPESIRTPNGVLKGLLKSTVSEQLPESILYREKRGFSIPLRVWGKKLIGSTKFKQERILNDFLSLF